jgi:hypothetical protein
MNIKLIIPCQETVSGHNSNNNALEALLDYNIKLHNRMNQRMIYISYFKKYICKKKTLINAAVLNDLRFDSTERFNLDI